MDNGVLFDSRKLYESINLLFAPELQLQVAQPFWISMMQRCLALCLVVQKLTKCQFSKARSVVFFSKLQNKRVYKSPS